MNKYRRMIRTAGFTLLLALAVILAGRYSIKAEEIPELDITKATMYVGWEQINIEPLGTDEDDIITFTTKNEEIASADELGYVTAVSPGKVKVYAKVKRGDETYSFPVTVTVKEPYCKSVGAPDGRGLGQEFVFSITQYGYSEPVTWQLIGSEYAEITSVSPTDARVKALKPGKIIVSGTSRDYHVCYEITIYNAKGTAFVISPKSAPYNNKYTDYGTYNSRTKHYYVLRSYLERLSAIGGGVLVLESGTYTVTNTLCIPSNTTILMLDGSRIEKSDVTGTAGLSATRSLFQTVSYGHSAQTGIFSGYNGEHDIALIGEGSATIDMMGINCASLVAAHCRRLTVKNINFLNMSTGHFIELDASCDVEISGNFFSGYDESETYRKEAINLDTPDLATGGFSQNWTSYDGTPNLRVKICDNVFYDLEVAIGTHKYTEGKVHTDIEISRNTFIDVITYAIRPMNWKDVKICDNLIKNNADSDGMTSSGIVINGAENVTVVRNCIEGYVMPISLANWKNTGKGKEYAPLYNNITREEISLMQTNIARNCDKNRIFVYSVLDDYSDDNLKTYIMNQ